MIIKICGITSLQDAVAAIELGADMLGFVLHPKSSRFIKMEDAGKIIAKLPAEVVTVAVYLASDHLNIDKWPGDALQIHGLKDQSQLPVTNKRLIAATSVRNHAHFADVEIVFDESMGQGQVADWQELAKIQRPFMLSGGLKPENVAEAVRIVQPAAVDVSSGIESSPGKKDHSKMQAFIQIARQSAKQINGESNNEK
jgi:phosphoribosylanthranilate isomerase